MNVSNSIVAMQIDTKTHPLCHFFLAKYFSKTNDPSNFPLNEIPQILDRYEAVFTRALTALNVTKESLRSRPEFNFDSGNVANFESAVAVLRVAEALRFKEFRDVALIKSGKTPGADFTCTKNGSTICVEVKTLTKQSSGKKGRFFEEQLYEKLTESIGKARQQVLASAAALKCSRVLIAFVVNWFAQSIYLGESDYQAIVDRLEKDGEQENLRDIDGVLFVTQMGQVHFFRKDGVPL